MGVVGKCVTEETPKSDLDLDLWFVKKLPLKGNVVNLDESGFKSCSSITLFSLILLQPIFSEIGNYFSFTYIAET